MAPINRLLFLLNHCLCTVPDRVPVVDCYWKKEWFCKTLPDYSVNTSATSQVPVSIHNVTEEKAGIYTCSLAGSQVDDRKSCELSIAQGKR